MYRPTDRNEMQERTFGLGPGPGLRLGRGLGLQQKFKSKRCRVAVKSLGTEATAVIMAGSWGNATALGGGRYKGLVLSYGGNGW